MLQGSTKSSCGSRHRHRCIGACRRYAERAGRGGNIPGASAFCDGSRLRSTPPSTWRHGPGVSGTHTCEQLVISRDLDACQAPALARRQ